MYRNAPGLLEHVHAPIDRLNAAKDHAGLVVTAPEPRRVDARFRLLVEALKLGGVLLEEFLPVRGHQNAAGELCGQGGNHQAFSCAGRQGKHRMLALLEGLQRGIDGRCPGRGARQQSRLQWPCTNLLVRNFLFVLEYLCKTSSSIVFIVDLLATAPFSIVITIGMPA